MSVIILLTDGVNNRGEIDPLTAARAALASAPDHVLGYPDPRGLPQLRTALAGYLAFLRLAGKPAKVALTACMRKLLVILNAMLKNRTYWNPQLPLTA